MKYKIGQIIELENGFNIEKFAGGIVQAKKGDKVLICRNSVKILDGNAINTIIHKDNFNFIIKGYDYENISKMITNRINKVFNLEEFLLDEEINSEEIALEIEDLLFDIL